MTLLTKNRKPPTKPFTINRSSCVNESNTTKVGEGKESAFEISPNKMFGIKDPFFWFQEKVGLESHEIRSEISM